MRLAYPLLGKWFLLCCVALFVSAVFVVRPATAGAESRVIDLATKSGVAWQFQPEGGDWKTIDVPGGGWRAQGYTCDAGKYRTTINIPLSAAGQEIDLDFAAINFGADILVGSTPESLTKVASHIDGWLPIKADITRYAVPGKPLVLEVDVAGRKKFMVHGKYTVPEGATWDPYLEDGILRGVSLEVLPKVHVDRVWVTSSVSQNVVNAGVTITNSSSSSKSVKFDANVLDSAAKATGLNWPIASVTLAANETRTITLAPLKWTLGPGSYWWPNVPYRRNYRAKLYQVSVDLKTAGGSEHQYTQTFGFREFTARGNHYYLNGVRCNLRGDNLQEADFGTDAYGIRPGFGPPSPGNGGWPEAVDNLQRLNFNVMRIHQIPATPYMLDVCDQKGLMLVEESPLRGSEGGEDYQDGKDNMLNMDRELVERDRNHPSVIIWSAANEWSDPVADATQAILAIDPTRPVIADGAGAGAPAIDTGHYLSGFAVVPRKGATPREDRPYGETEDIWPADNTLQGFAWMGTGIRLRRLNGDADLRNYTLNNAWPNFVPGETPENEVLEKKVKGMDSGAAILPVIADPWHNANIQLMQNCYNPVAVADIDFDTANANSNPLGQWPVKTPTIAAGSHVTRSIAVFNDEFFGDTVRLAWRARLGAADGPIIGSGAADHKIVLGEFAKVDVTFDAPAKDGQKVWLLLTASKSGVVRCVENQISFITGGPNAAAVSAGDYAVQNELSGLYLGVSGDGKSLVQDAKTDTHQMWTVSYHGSRNATLINKATGMAIDAGTAAANNGDPISLVSPAGSTTLPWELKPSGDGFTITSPASGRVMDDFRQSHDAGSPVVLYDSNGGANQIWDFVPVNR